MTILDVQGLSKRFELESGLLRQRAGQVQALQDVSFQVQAGETMGLVGGSGCGKSTLARIIAGLLPADSGRVLWQSEPLENLSPLEKAQRIQMIIDTIDRQSMIRWQKLHINSQ